jgi:hypothetical protein
MPAVMMITCLGGIIAITESVSNSRKIAAASKTAKLFAEPHAQKLTGVPYRPDGCGCLVVPGYAIDEQGNQIEGSPDKLVLSYEHLDYQDLNGRTFYKGEIVTWQHFDDSVDYLSVDPASHLRFKRAAFPGTSINGFPRNIISQISLENASPLSGRVFFNFADPCQND